MRSVDRSLRCHSTKPPRRTIAGPRGCKQIKSPDCGVPEERSVAHRAGWVYYVADKRRMPPPFLNTMRSRDLSSWSLRQGVGLLVWLCIGTLAAAQDSIDELKWLY